MYKPSIGRLNTVLMKLNLLESTHFYYDAVFCRTQHFILSFLFCVNFFNVCPSIGASDLFNLCITSEWLCSSSGINEPMVTSEMHNGFD